MSEQNGNGRKAIDLADVERKSVVDRPDPPTDRNPLPSFGSSGIFWFATQFADEIVPFAKAAGKTREIQLRNFILAEPIFASALGIMCARNAGFSWKIDAPPRTAQQLQFVLDTANLGEGWHDLMAKTSVDLYTQDDGAFWEIVREENDNPGSPVIGINHLDAARCYHTGSREIPVVYMDRKGLYHKLYEWQVVTFADLPVPIEGLYGKQYSVLSRLLTAMQIQRNINLRKLEKTSGRGANSIELVKGITSQQLNDAITEAQTYADSQGLTRHMKPIVVGTIDPTADVGHDTILLAGMPEDYSEEVQFKHYINQIAMAFSSDYQEFAPLPGGGLGTGAQSEMLHLKSQGKGPGHFMKIISHALNMRIFPKNAKFWWSEQDMEAEKLQAEVAAIRAQTRAVRIASFEIDPIVARQIANDDGDLSDELLAMMGEQDLTENSVVTDDVGAEYSSEDQGKPQRTIRTPSTNAPARVISTRPLAPRSAGKEAADRTRKILDLFADD